MMKVKKKENFRTTWYWIHTASISRPCSQTYRPSRWKIIVSRAARSYLMCPPCIATNKSQPSDHPPQTISIKERKFQLQKIESEKNIHVHPEFLHPLLSRASILYITYKKLTRLCAGLIVQMYDVIKSSNLSVILVIYVNKTGLSVSCVRPCVVKTRAKYWPTDIHWKRWRWNWLTYGLNGREMAAQSTDGMFGFKVGQIGPKLGKSGTFSDQISVHLARWAEHTIPGQYIDRENLYESLQLL